MTLALAQTLEGRLPKTASDNSRHSLRSALMIADGFSKKVRDIREDTKLSDEGKREAVDRIKAATLKGSHLEQLHNEAKKALDGIRSQREGLRLMP